MVSARQVSNQFRRLVVSVLLVSLLWLVAAPIAQADSASGAPESTREKQKTVYEGKRNVVNSPGEPATINRSTNANASTASSKTSETVKADRSDRSETAIEQLGDRIKDTFDNFKERVD